jgi:hypothetical protein
MKRTPWLPANRAKRKTIFTNVKAKIPLYATTLEIDSVTEDRVLLICDTFIALDDYVEGCKATTESLIEWRDLVYEDETILGDAPPPPSYAAFVALPGMFCGILDEFRKYVEQWKKRDGYTKAIGEDLMIIGDEAPPVPESISPEITVEARPNYVLRITGKMKGLKAVQIEWQAKGSASFGMIGMFTLLPGTVTVTPVVPGDPISGRIRAIFMDKNEPFGDYSPEYSVTAAQ